MAMDWEAAISRDLIRECQEAEAAAEIARRRLSDEIVSKSPFQKGDIVRDKDTGNRYRITGGSGFHHRGRPNLQLAAVRVYSTGRRDASSTTYLQPYNIEKVPA